jgi:hypothetical protein
VPFFGILLGYLRLVERPTACFTERGLCATACTDGERIVYCREWFEELLRTDPEMILTVLAHDMGTYPEAAPSHPVLWVLTPHHATPPFGTTTVLTLEEHAA